MSFEAQSDRLKILIEWVEAEPSDPFNRYALALEQMRLGLEKEAEQNFRQLVGHEHEYLPAFYQFALLLMKSSRTAEAASVLEQGIVLAERQKMEKTRLELTFLLEDLPDS